MNVAFQPLVMMERYFLRDVKEIYEKPESPENFCVFQTSGSHDLIFYFNPIAHKACDKDGLFDAYPGHFCDKPIKPDDPVKIVSPITCVIGPYDICQALLE